MPVDEYELGVVKTLSSGARHDSIMTTNDDEQLLQNQDVDDVEHEGSSSSALLGNSQDANDQDFKMVMIRYYLSFFLFGTLNNVLYVIVLSAALDLVPSDVPKAIVLFCNIAPALVVKVGWPYFLRGPVQYKKRVIGCSILSFCGMMVVAMFPSLFMRLLGIAFASASSGLGEMTYLQLSTSYGDDGLGTRAVGWFASGTGAAGFIGAGLWWLLRSLGVQVGLGLSSILPICMGLCFLFLLPSTHNMKKVVAPNSAKYSRLDSEDPDVEPSRITRGNRKDVTAGFTWQEKRELAAPLVFKYMIPLFTVYLAEYTINTGVAPGLIYPIPTTKESPIWSKLIKSLRDYYPLWQLTYQTFVFFSRSSVSLFRLPPLASKLIFLPSLLQLFLLCLVILESAVGILSHLLSQQWILFIIFVLISLEGICGGTAYVSVYHWLGIEKSESENPTEEEECEEVKISKREFRMACVGFADTTGILFASLVSAWLEPTLCKLQVDRGRTLCREL